VVPFNRVIPIEQRIEFIGRRIAEEEPDLLLAWAVAGASRLIREHKFSIPQSCEQAFRDWMTEADAVLAWLSECVKVHEVRDDLPAVATNVAYRKFHDWAIEQGFKKDNLPAINGFTRRVRTNLKGVKYSASSRPRKFVGMVVA